MRDVGARWQGFKAWLVHKAGGYTEVENTATIWGVLSHMNKEVDRVDKLYKDTRQRVEFHVLRDTFGNQDTDRRRLDFTNYLHQKLDEAIDSYFFASPDLGDTRDAALSGVGSVKSRG